MTLPHTRAAVVQIASAAFDREATLEKVRHWAAKAAGEGAQLVLFPEALVSAYPWGQRFGAMIGNRTEEGREWFRRYWASAVDVPGPAVDALAGLAGELKIHLVIGVIERDGGTLYCTVLFFSPSGYLGKHRKVMPTAMERLCWGYGDGSTLPAYDTPLGKVGAVICWENYMPLMRTAMYAKGVQIYCAPTADQRDVWAASMRHIAVEGRCFVLSANQFTTRADFPADYPAEEDACRCRGGSMIVDPFGRVLAGPHYEGEAVLVADLDLNEIPKGKFDFDAVGHYARPDIFQLTVDERPKPAVRSVSATD